jgi:hypothetical protein
VVHLRNYDDTLSLVTTAGKVSLGRSAAEKVWVARPRATVPPVQKKN